MAISELAGAAGWQLHAIGAMLLAGRVLHFFGFGADPERMPLRVLGMVLTFSAILGGALANLATLL